jgi:hypothetical protein
MRRTWLILALGLIVGAGTHFVYFRWNAPQSDSPAEHLAWLKSDLQLTDAQYARILALHQASSPQIRALSAQVAQLRAEFSAFEAGRRDRDQVDFIEFARFVEARRQVNRACADSTRQLVLATAQVMTPAQRARYLDFVKERESTAHDLLN